MRFGGQRYGSLKDSEDKQRLDFVLHLLVGN